MIFYDLLKYTYYIIIIELFALQWNVIEYVVRNGNKTHTAPLNIEQIEIGQSMQIDIIVNYYYRWWTAADSNRQLKLV